MSPGKKVLIGLFTLSQVAVIAIIMVVFFMQIQELEMVQRHYDSEPTDEFLTLMASFFGGMVLFFLLALGNIIFYCIHAYRNPAVREDMRIVWILIVIFGGFMGEIVYYFMHIVNEPPAVQPINREPFS